MTKTQRLIELIMVVYEKKKFTVDELASDFGVSYRTMLRYLQELSGMGVPLYSEVGKYGGYSIINPKHKMSMVERAGALTKHVIKPVTHIVGIECMAPFTAVYMANALIPKLWTELMERKDEIASFASLADPKRMIGAVQNRSQFYHYVAGVEVKVGSSIPSGMVSLTLPVQAYAVYTHQGGRQREDKDETYFYALEKLRRQSMEHDPTGYCLELYSSKAAPDAGNMLEIYIPLQ